MTEISPLAFVLACLTEPSRDSLTRRLLRVIGAVGR